MRVLIASPHPQQVAALVKLLHNNGFLTDSVGTIDDALSALSLAPYDAIVLDLGAYDPGHDNALRAVRARDPELRILVLSDTNSATARVEALNKGADDFLDRRFTEAELLARLRALLRRPGQTVRTKLQAANVELDTEAARVLIDGKPARLRRREFATLEALMRNKGMPVPRERLEHAVFSFDSAVTPNALEVTISRLRRSLLQQGAHLAVAVQRGVGYALVVRERPSGPARARSSGSATATSHKGKLMSSAMDVERVS